MAAPLLTALLCGCASVDHFYAGERTVRCSGQRYIDFLAEPPSVPYVEVARQCDWSAGPLPVVGVEVGARARLPVGSGEREVRFRADRVDRRGGRLRLTDYKTGAPKPPKSDRGEALPAALARRQMLQAAIYAAVEYTISTTFDTAVCAAVEESLDAAINSAVDASVECTIDAAIATADKPTHGTTTCTTDNSAIDATMDAAVDAAINKSFV